MTNANPLKARASCIATGAAALLLAAGVVSADAVVDSGADFAADATGVSRELDSCRTQVGNLSEALSGAKAEAGKCSDTLTAVKEELAERDARLATIDAQLGDCRRESAQAAGALNAAESLLASNKRALEEAGARNTALVGDAEKLKSELEDVASRLQAVASERDELKPRLSALEVENTRLGERLSAIFAGEAAADDVQAAKEAVTALGAEYAELYGKRHKVPEAKETLSQMRGWLRSRQLVIAALSGARGIHQVQKGETLSGIARSHYEHSRQWHAIYQANDYLLENPDQLLPGVTLVIP